MQCSRLRLTRPFTVAATRRVAVVPSAHADRSPAGGKRLLGAGLGAALLQAPAFAAEDLLSTTQRLPSPEEVASKAQAANDGGFFDLFADNPVLIVGLGLLALFPLAFSFLGGGALGVKSVTAASAFEGLSSDPGTVLLDIRPKAEVKEQGSPNLGSIRKKPIALPYTIAVDGEVEEVEDFVEQFGALRQIQPDSSIIIIDSFGQEAPKAAKKLAKLAGRVYYVTDGAEGPRGWRESGQPWKEPFKAKLNLDSLAEDFKSQPTIAKAGVAVGALGVAGALFFQEVGTLLEVAAVAAAGAWALPRFLGSGGTSDAGGTQKRQVQQFVEQQEAAAGRAAAAAEKQAGKAASQVREVVAKPERAQAGAKQAAAKVQEAVEQPGQTADKVAATVENTAEKAAGQASAAEAKVEGAVGDAAKAAESSAAEAREWIEQWRKENVKA